MSTYPQKAGIYKCTCKHNGKIYIGKSVNIYKRMDRHKNCHKSMSSKYHFQNAIIKYGWESFEIEILEVFENFNKQTDNHLLLERESFFIRLFNSTDPNKGYNICKYSTDTTGIPLSKSHKDKIRKSLLGRTFSKETKEKMKNAQLGKTLSKETKEKLRQHNLGKVLSKETKDKIRKSCSGKIFSLTHREKIKKSKLGIPRSEETKAKIRSTMLEKSKKLNK